MAVEIFVIVARAVAGLRCKFKFVVELFDYTRLKHLSALRIHRMGNVSVKLCPPAGIMFNASALQPVAAVIAIVGS